MAARPLTAVGAAVGWPLVLAAVHFWLRRGAAPGPASLLAGEAVLATGAVGMVAALGWWRAAGFTARIRPAWRLLAPAPLLAIYLAVAVAGISRSGGRWDALPLLLGLSVLVGLAEETLIRGVVLAALSPLGALTAGAGSAALFGVLHFANLLSGAAADVTLAQVTQASLVGLLLAAIRWRVLSIWPVVLLHVLIDFPLLLVVPPHVPPHPFWLPLVAALAITLPFGAAAATLLWLDAAGREIRLGRWPL